MSDTQMPPTELNTSSVLLSPTKRSAVPTHTTRRPLGKLVAHQPTATNNNQANNAQPTNAQTLSTPSKINTNVANTTNNTLRPPTAQAPQPSPGALRGFFDLISPEIRRMQSTQSSQADGESEELIAPIPCLFDVSDKNTNESLECHETFDLLPLPPTVPAPSSTAAPMKSPMSTLLSAVKPSNAAKAADSATPRGLVGAFNELPSPSTTPKNNGAVFQFQLNGGSAAMTNAPAATMSKSHSSASARSSSALDEVDDSDNGSAAFRFSCQECAKTFPSNSALSMHLLVHSGEKPFACPSAGCSKRFRQKGHLVSHYRKHTGEKPFACPGTGCSKRFKDKSGLNTHVKRQHPGVSAAHVTASQPVDEEETEMDPELEQAIAEATRTIQALQASTMAAVSMSSSPMLDDADSEKDSVPVAAAPTNATKAEKNTSNKDKDSSSSVPSKSKKRSHSRMSLENTSKSQPETRGVTPVSGGNVVEGDAPHLASSSTADASEHITQQSSHDGSDVHMLASSSSSASSSASHEEESDKEKELESILTRATEVTQNAAIVTAGNPVATSIAPSSHHVASNVEADTISRLLKKPRGGESPSLLPRLSLPTHSSGSTSYSPLPHVPSPILFSSTLSSHSVSRDLSAHMQQPQHPRSGHSTPTPLNSAWMPLQMVPRPTTPLANFYMPQPPPISTSLLPQMSPMTHSGMVPAPMPSAAFHPILSHSYLPPSGLPPTPLNTSTSSAFSFKPAHTLASPAMHL